MGVKGYHPHILQNQNIFVITNQRSENRVEYLDTYTFVVSISRYLLKKIYPKQSI